MAKYFGPAQPCYDCGENATENLGKRIKTHSGRAMGYFCEDCANIRLGKSSPKPVESTPPQASRSASFEAGHQKGPQNPPEQLTLF